MILDLGGIVQLTENVLCENLVDDETRVERGQYWQSSLDNIERGQGTYLS